MASAAVLTRDALGVALPDVPVSEEEFERWAFANNARAEYVDGRVTLLAPDNTLHDSLFGFLHTLLWHAVVERGTGEVKGPSFMARLRPGLRRMPDIIVVLGEDAHLVRHTYLAGAPAAAFEIVSPESRRRDREWKPTEYEAAGIREYWLVDPEVQAVVLYRLGAKGHYARVEAQEGWLQSEAIPGFRVRPEWLWQRPFPSLLACLRELGIPS